MADRVSYVKMKARHQKMLMPWHKKWWGVFLIVLMCLLIALALFSSIYVLNRIKDIKQSAQTKLIEKQSSAYLGYINGDGTNFSLGVPADKVSSGTITIIEFGNFSCQYSALSAPAIRKIAEDFSEKIRFVYRDYPGQESIIMSLGARCAGEQGKFWPMHDMLYEMQNDMSTLLEDSERRDFLLQMSDILGLDKDKFTSCLDEKKYLNQVKRDYEDGEKLQIKGTPTWFVDGFELTGSLNENNFRDMLSGLMK